MKLATRLALILLALSAAGCTTIIARNPAPEGAAGVAAPYGVTSKRDVIRNWGDDHRINRIRRDTMRDYAARLRAAHADEIRRTGAINHSVLALSGGGPDGAFGAGLLVGWTARGDRPEFATVTGVSTGAIIALFAFLGPDYDNQLQDAYTKYRTDQLLTPAIFTALSGGSAATDTTGYENLIKEYVDDEVMRRLAEGAEKGRMLLVGTTNLDAARPVIWNLTGIAASGHPDAERLVEDVIRASSAIPGVFPPVLIPVVNEDGETFDEMHVDGGATQQVMLFTPGFPLRRLDRLVGKPVNRSLYVVMNNKLSKPYRPVRPRLIPIAAAAASSLLGGSGASDIFRIYAIAERDDLDLNVIAIPKNFDREAAEAFDPEYMTALFQLGYEYGLDGTRWADHPPGFARN